MCILSQNLNLNKDLYKARLQQIFDLLLSLSTYHYNDKYTTYLFLFTQIRNSLDSTETTIPIKDPQIVENEKDTTIVPSQTNNLTFNFFATKKNKSAQLSPIDQAVEAKNHLIAKKLLPIAEQLSAFMVFEEKVSDALLVEDSRQLSTFENTLKLKTLFSEKLAEGKRLLVSLLFEGKYELASKLQKYAPSVAEKLIAIALNKGNAEMLSFLLTHSQYAINTSIIIDNLTPVIFCFKHDDAASKARCLSVLIKHKASIMIKVNNGLPLAYYLLNAPSPALKQALIDNTELTIGYPPFYKALIYHLRDFLANNDVDAELKNMLLLDISNYEYQLNSCSKELGSSFVKKQNEQLLDNHRSYLTSTTLNSAVRDELFTAKFSAVIHSLNLFINELSAKEKLRATTYQEEKVKKVETLLLSVDFNNKKQKETIMGFLDKLHHIFDLSTELKSLQKIPSKTLRSKDHKISRDRIQKLLQELNSLNAAKVLDNFFSVLDDITSDNKTITNGVSLEKYRTARLLKLFGINTENTKEEEMQNLSSISPIGKNM